MSNTKNSFVLSFFKRFHRQENAALPENFTVTAHAGSMHTPANGLFSLSAGIRAGADTVEFDLNTNKAGIGVLAHTYPEKAKATLDEAFRLIAEHDKIQVNVDVKSTACLAQVQELAQKYGILDRIFYTGLSADSIPAAKEKSPLVPYYLNSSPERTDMILEARCDELCDKALALGAVGLNMHFSLVTKKLVASAHNKGLLVSVWTVNREEDMRKCLRLGVDNITTKKPLRLVLIK